MGPTAWPIADLAGLVLFEMVFGALFSGDPPSIGLGW